jgi:hypothetical protein
LLQPEIRIKELRGANIAHPQALLIKTHMPDKDGLHKHIDICYAFITNETPRNKPSEGESQQLFWYNLEEINRLTQDKIRESTQQIINHVFENILNQWEEVNPGEYQN